MPLLRSAIGAVRHIGRFRWNSRVHASFDSAGTPPYPAFFALAPASSSCRLRSPTEPLRRGYARAADRSRLSRLGRWASGNTGIPYVWTFAANVAGPHVLVQALTHGNEVCGAIALDWLLGEGFPSRRAARCPCASPTSPRTRRFDRADPFGSRCVDEDFNRLWTADVLDGPRRDRRPRPRACAASALRARRLPARSPFDDRPMPAARDGGPAAQGRRARAGARVARSTSSSTAGTRPAGGCATTRSSTIPRTRAMRS